FERFVMDARNPGRLARYGWASLPSGCEATNCGLVSFIHEDRNGVLWIGVFREGLFRYDPNRNHVAAETYDPDEPDRLANNDLWSIAETRDGALWMGCISGSNNRLHRITERIERFPHFVHEPGDPNSLS